MSTARAPGGLVERTAARLAAIPPRGRLAAVAVLLAVQLAVPASWILGLETTLAEGRAYRFLTAPVDPADPLRGRYVALRFEEERIEVPDGMTVAAGDRVAVVVSEGADGFARLGPISETPPAAGDWIELPVRWVGEGSGSGSDPTRFATVELPFDRLYLEESEAPAAEELVARLGREGEVRTWAIVRVHDGEALLEDLVVDGVPIRERLRNGEAGP